MLNKILFYIIITISISSCSIVINSNNPRSLKPFNEMISIYKIWKIFIKNKGENCIPIVIEDKIYAAGSYGEVVKISSQTGKEIWRINLNKEISSGIGGNNGLVIISTSSGELYAINKNGKILWKNNEIRKEIKSPAILSNNNILIQTIDGDIYYLQIETGKIKWIYNTKIMPLYLYKIPKMIFINNTTILAGFPSGVISAINSVTGDIYWENIISYPYGYTISERINSIIGISHYKLNQIACAISFQGNINCFNINSGQSIWKYLHYDAKEIVQNDSMVITSNINSIIKAFDLFTGKLLWTNNKLKNRDIGSLLILGNAIAVGDYKGFLHLLSCKDGSLISRATTDGSKITSAPIFSKKTLIVQTNKGHLFGFNVK